jgi:hypothetical protein
MEESDFFYENAFFVYLTVSSVLNFAKAWDNSLAVLLLMLEWI